MAYAHSRNDRGERHDLVEHLRTVSGTAAGFAEAFGGGELARYLGLWHDLGKFNPEFQRYLERCELNPKAKGTGPDHKGAGASLAKVNVQPLALLVAGHHGGLKTRQHVRDWLGKREGDPAVHEALVHARRVLPAIDPPARPPLPEHLAGDRVATEFFLRMLFSALVDADHLDTEHHFQREKAEGRGGAPALAELWERFERRHAEIARGKTGPVNDVRREVYASCLEAAEGPPGLYRLAVPTGGGKTLSGMAFALRHALRWDLRRVVVAVPFITITEQTARAYRDAFEVGEDANEPVVLEHHSGAREADPDEAGDFHRERTWTRLAAENWDAQVVVTTTVQLFESLFGNGTSRTRKLHRLARSVIILDEAQALPTHLLSPALDGLRELTAHYGATVVLSTATQPAFEVIPEFARVEAREIVPDPARHFRTLRRVTYEWRDETALPWDEIAALMREESRALAVVNTKRDALALLDALGDPEALHLSTSLCGAHRRDVIERVRRRLKRGEPCRLVSTQVVEAGVDLDFPLVLRALGPLDGIIQAAGRCNREGRLERGRVLVFRPEGGGMPRGSYAVGAQTTQTLRGAGEIDPDDPETAREYYRLLYGAISHDPREIQGLRERFEYPEVAKRFRMIEDDTEDAVVTTYASPDAPLRERETELQTVRNALERLRWNPASARHVLRELQPYTVALRVRDAERYRREGLLGELLPDLRVGEWMGEYDPVRGLLGRDARAESWVEG